MKLFFTLTIAANVLLSVAFSRAATNGVPAAAEKTKACFLCAGTGEGKCTRSGCREGKVDCPGPCVKLSGKWEKRDIPGHGPDELWQNVKFIPRGNGYVSRGHVGEYFTVDAAGKVTPHNCDTCGHTSLINCPVCKGKGTMVCPICEGRKVIPESWSAFDHPKMKSRPSRFQLKDGSTIVGRKVMVSGSSATIRTASGDVKVETSDIQVEESQTGSR